MRGNRRGLRRHLLESQLQRVRCLVRRRKIGDREPVGKLRAQRGEAVAQQPVYRARPSAPTTSPLRSSTSQARRSALRPAIRTEVGLAAVAAKSQAMRAANAPVPKMTMSALWIMPGRYTPSIRLTSAIGRPA